MPLIELGTDLWFPPHKIAVEGMLAQGGDLSPERLMLAYRNGIFPWFNPGEPIIWWSPDPRMVLLPGDLKVARSMRPLFNQHRYTVTFDREFEQVMEDCGSIPREGQFGTWISDEMIEAYLELHNLGWAHSVEVWDEGELVGGLYGVSEGGCFFGESMFSYEPNASKYGFITLVRFLQQKGFSLIDCQVYSEHLESLGAKEIPRGRFLKMLKEGLARESWTGKWELPESFNPLA